MISSGQVSTAGAVIAASAFFIILVVGGITVAIVLALIPTYLSTRSLTPSGEKYCINNILLNVTFNSTTPNGNFTSLIANTSYPLSEACYRILKNYKSDSLLSSCLFSNCSFTGNVTADTQIVAPNISCSAVIYYSSRCPDEAPSSGLYNSIYATTNSACRTRRMKAINGALGASSSVQFTNVATLVVSNVLIPIRTISTEAFSTYSQVGAFYCGAISQTSIASAVNTQATG